MKYQAIVASLTLFVLSACAESSTASRAESAGAAELSREAAVSEAQQDARSRFNLTAANVMASRSGRFWLIDLRTQDGARAHYAIGTDGSIRERRLYP
ncbi:MAG: hypothetical protein QM820_51970 [Minicystis sp.]